LSILCAPKYVNKHDKGIIDAEGETHYFCAYFAQKWIISLLLIQRQVLDSDMNGQFDLSKQSLISEENNDESEIQVSIESPLSSKAMKKLLAFKPRPLPREPSLVSLLQKIPFFTGFLRSVDHAGNALSGIAQIQGDTSKALKEAVKGFHFTGLALNVIDFLRIPAIYLAFAIAGEKPPITLSRNARWLYSALLVALTITALALPAVAVPMALTAGSLAFGLSVFTLGKAFYQRYQLRKELKGILGAIEAKTQQLDKLQQEMVGIEKDIELTTDSQRLEALKGSYSEKSDAFVREYEAQKNDLQTLYDKKLKCEKKLKNKGFMGLADKGITVALSSLGLIGLTLSLFFPPVGLAILATSATLAGLYLIARVGFPVVAKWIAERRHKKMEAAVSSDEPKPKEHSDVSLKSEDRAELSKPKIQSESATPTAIESTGKTMNLLFGEAGASLALQEQIACSQLVGKIQPTLSVIVDSHDLHGILVFFSHVSSLVKKSDNEVTVENIRQFFNNFDDLESVFPLLKEALDEAQNSTSKVGLSDKDKNLLLEVSALVDFLSEQGIDLKTALLKLPNAENEKDIKMNEQEEIHTPSRSNNE